MLDSVQATPAGEPAGETPSPCASIIGDREWARLVAADPDAFEALRKEAIEAFLKDSPERQRRMGMLLQHEIDAGRQGAADSEGALLLIAQMLGQQVAFLAEGLTSLSDAMRRLRVRRPPGAIS